MMNLSICFLSKELSDFLQVSWLTFTLVPRHSDPNAIQSARSLALSLVGTLAQDFVQWQREQQAAQHQQQQQQQQFIYTFSQPYYSG